MVEARLILTNLDIVWVTKKPSTKRAGEALNSKFKKWYEKNNLTVVGHGIKSNWAKRFKDSERYKHHGNVTVSNVNKGGKLVVMTATPPGTGTLSRVTPTGPPGDPAFQQKGFENDDSRMRMMNQFSEAFHGAAARKDDAAARERQQDHEMKSFR